jgi:excisionase family DNA binding protein
MADHEENVKAKAALGMKHRALTIRNRLIDVESLAEYVGLSPHTIYTMVSQRRIPFVKVGRLTKFDLQAIDAWILQHSVKPSLGPQSNP